MLEKSGSTHNKAIVNYNGEYVTYEQLHAEALEMEEYQKHRMLTCVVCDKTYETVKLVYKLFYLKQPMLFVSHDATDTYIEDIVQRFQVNYLWKNQSLKLIKEKTGEGEKRIHKDLAVMLSTSGSVGKPKFVKLSYENFKIASEIGKNEMGVKEGQTGMLVVPLEHILGLIFCIYHWAVNGTIVVSPYNVMDSRFEELYDRECVNNIAGVPLTYAMLKKTEFWDAKDRVERLNLAMAAGAKMDKALQEYLVLVLNRKLKLCYGQTELTGGPMSIQCYSANDKVCEESIGKTVPGVKAYIEDDELVVESHTACMGYACSVEDLLTGDENYGKIYTGDIALIDENGEIYLKGRKARFIKLSGHRYHLNNIEDIIKKVIYKNVVCTGCDDNLNVYVKIQDNEQEILEEVKKYLLSNLDISMHMLHVKKIDEIPKSSTGKVLYSKLG